MVSTSLYHSFMVKLMMVYYFFNILSPYVSHFSLYISRIVPYVSHICHIFPGFSIFSHAKDG